MIISVVILHSAVLAQYRLVTDRQLMRPLREVMTRRGTDAARLVSRPLSHLTHTPFTPFIYNVKPRGHAIKLLDQPVVKPVTVKHTLSSLTCMP